MKDPVKFVSKMLDYLYNIKIIKEELSDWDLPKDKIARIKSSGYDEIQSIIGEEWTYLTRYFTIATADCESGGAIELAIYYVLTNSGNKYSTSITDNKTIYSGIGETINEFKCDGVTLASDANVGYYQVGCYPRDIYKVIELIQKHKKEIVKLAKEIENNPNDYGYYGE